MELNEEALTLLREHVESLEKDRQNQSPELRPVDYFHEFVRDFEPWWGDERDRNIYALGFLECVAAFYGTSACHVLEVGLKAVESMGPLPTPSFEEVDDMGKRPPPPPPPEPTTGD